MTVATQTPIAYATVPRCWPGETVVCLGTGPSLTVDDVESCRDRARVIAIKDAVRIAPWADVLYCGDEKWWPHHGPSLTFPGRRYALVASQAQADAIAPFADLLRYTGPDGIETDPSGLRSGSQSGYQAIGLAVHLGAARIVLLGYDMRGGANGRVHFFGAHAHDSKKPTPWQQRPELFQTLVPALEARGIAIVNASRVTALDCFPRMPLAEALA